MIHLAALAVFAVAGIEPDVAVGHPSPPGLPMPEQYAPENLGQEPMIYANPAPRIPRGAWWYSGMVPCAWQRHVWYPSWDDPLGPIFNCPPQGVPAPEVPQNAIPAWWRRFGQ